jgi:single-strand DNA-binding protein
MAKSLNRVTLLGNVGKEPIVENTTTGKTVCKFSIATTESYRDKSEQWQEITDWHNIVIWGKLAEVAGKYLQKGNKVYIDGKLKTRSYDKDNITRCVTEVIADNMVLLPNGSQAEQTQAVNNAYAAPEPNDNGEVPF